MTFVPIRPERVTSPLYLSLPRNTYRNLLRQQSSEGFSALDTETTDPNVQY